MRVIFNEELKAVADDEHDADDDTLDDANNALLSMLPLASIVVDEHDEVIRAHPSAYSLGVVRDDHNGSQRKHGKQCIGDIIQCVIIGIMLIIVIAVRQ